MHKQTKWTLEEDQFLIKNYQNKSNKYLCSVMNKPINSIVYRAKKLNLKSRISKRINIEQFTTKITETTAYILGLLWADGYISQNNKVCLETKRTDMLYFYQLLKTTGFWYLFTRERRGRKPQATAGICDIKFTKALQEKLGIESNRFDFSKIWNLLTEDLKPLFILGLFDGDGCCYTQLIKGKTLYQFSISGRSNQNWLPIINYLNNKNIRCYLSKEFKNCVQLRITSPKEFIKFGKLLYTNTCLGIFRKKIKFINAFHYYSENSTGLLVGL